MKTLFQSKMSSLLIVAAVVFLCLGCTTVNQIEEAQNKSVQQMEILQEQSVGKIPCRSDEIEISEYKINESDGSGYWTAACLGKTYKCVRGKKDETNANDQEVTCEQIDNPEI
jgi:hypothetical protein